MTCAVAVVCLLVLSWGRECATTVKLVVWELDEVNDLTTEYEDGFSQSKESPQGSLFDAFENNYTGNELKKPKEIARAVIDITVCSADIIKVGYSFDNACLNEIPVILLRCRSKKNRKVPDQAQQQQVYLVGVKEINEHNLFKQQGHCVHKHKNMDTCNNLKDQKSSKFELIKLRVFHFKDQLCKINNNNLHVISNFQILYINESLRTLEIFYYDIHSKIIMQDFKLDNVENKDTHLSILDVYVEHESGLSYVFVFVKNGEVINILCLQISYANFYEHLTKAVTYDVKPISLSLFISPDLTHIIKYLQICSTTTNVDYSTKSESICSSLCLLTETRFAIKVVNGVIKSVINVNNSFEAEEFSVENWGSSCIKFVSLMGCDDDDDMVALRIDNFCCLINWSKEKVVKTWTSVYLISNNSDNHYGPPSLMIVFLPKDTGDHDHSLLFHLCESDFLFVSQDEMKEEENNDEENQTLSLKQPEEDIKQVEHPMRALLYQQKISEVAVKESESVLQNKISFVINSWKQLSQPSNDTVNFSAQAALVPLFHGSASTSRDNELPPKKPQGDHPRLIPFGLWKRTFDNFLIVGLSVKNNFTRPVTHICLKLIDSLTEGTQSTETTQTSHSRESGTLLFPGQSCDISCYANISQCFTGVGVTLLSFICFQYFNADFTASSLKSLPEHSEQFYAEVGITAEELLNGTYSVDKSVLCMKKDLVNISRTDLQALDIIQNSIKLSVWSIISSVGCLSLKLDQHPFCMYLDITKQYLITGSHQLRMCRVQILNQSSRNQLDIKIYARSDYEALLLVQFLNSLLPEDVTIIPEKATNSYLQELGGQVLAKTEHHISCIKNTLTGKVECPNEPANCSIQTKSKNCSDGKEGAVESVLQNIKSAGHNEMDLGEIQNFKKTKKR
ncbi:hypothetical protein Btru_044745 [Bulinus truncatus]|nr:hypothetical protein Btru_044745 [Bulinus truncatus]